MGEIGFVLNHNVMNSSNGNPGGFGTIEEVAEILTWAQLGLHTKPCGLINVDGYFDLLLSFLDHAVSKGFMKQEQRDMLLVSNSPEDILRQMEIYRAPKVEKWTEVKTRTQDQTADRYAPADFFVEPVEKVNLGV